MHGLPGQEAQEITAPESRSMGCRGLVQTQKGNHETDGRVPTSGGAEDEENEKELHLKPHDLSTTVLGYFFFAVYYEISRYLSRKAREIP